MIGASILIVLHQQNELTVITLLTNVNRVGTPEAKVKYAVVLFSAFLQFTPLATQVEQLNQLVEDMCMVLGLPPDTNALLS